MQVKVFKNKSFGKIRVIGDGENPLFCLSDVCKVLDLSTPAKIKKAILKEFELYELNSYSFDSGFGKKNFTMITEPQLYFILMRSDKPKAKPFRQWVVNDVLPSIRKQGYYIHTQPKSINIPESIPYREELANLIKAISEDHGIYFDRLKAFSIQQSFDEIKNEREITLKLSILKINETQITTTRRIR